MARPRTPSNVLELRGAYRHEPGRRRSEPPSNGALGSPPERLSELEGLAWAELAAQAIPGVLARSDRLCVEMASRLLAELWDLGREFPVARLRQLHVLLGLFGMSPADRSKIRVDPPRAASKYDDLGRT